MNTNQIQCVIDCDSVLKYKVLGVFARNQIPKRVDSFPCGFIVNTDNSDQPGTHWLAFYLKSENETELFDSYGHKPELFHFKATQYNNQRLQSSTTNVCGQYCLYFLFNRCRGRSMNAIIRQFTNDYAKNDAFVNNFIVNTFPYCFNVKYNFVKPQTCCVEIM